MAGTVVADKWQNGDGTENYKCRAWVNFNGTGTVAIRASGNVSSITDNGFGLYTINFITAMVDANYCINILWDIGGPSVDARWVNNINNINVNGFSYSTRYAVTTQDGPNNYVAIFR